MLTRDLFTISLVVHFSASFFLPLTCLLQLLLFLFLHLTQSLQHNPVTLLHGLRALRIRQCQTDSTRAQVQQFCIGKVVTLHLRQLLDKPVASLNPMVCTLLIVVFETLSWLVLLASFSFHYFYLFRYIV